MVASRRGKRGRESRGPGNLARLIRMAYRFNFSYVIATSQTDEPDLSLDYYRPPRAAYIDEAIMSKIIWPIRTRCLLSRRRSLIQHLKTNRKIKKISPTTFQRCWAHISAQPSTVSAYQLLGVIRWMHTLSKAQQHSRTQSRYMSHLGGLTLLIQRKVHCWSISGQTVDAAVVAHW